MTPEPPDEPREQPDEPRDDDSPESHSGRLQPLTGRAIALAATLGLVVGYLLHPVAVRLFDTAPIVTWGQVGALFFVAAFMAYVAWQTWHTLHVRRALLEPHRAMNRFVLARACALMGSFVAGGYAGYAVSWLGSHSELADQRLARCGAAVVAGVLILIASLYLERACRVRSGESDA